MTMTLRQQNSNEARSLRTWIANVAKSERDSWYKIPWARSSHLFLKQEPVCDVIARPESQDTEIPKRLNSNRRNTKKSQFNAEAKLSQSVISLASSLRIVARAQQNANVKNYQKPIHSPPHRPRQNSLLFHSSFFTEDTTFVLDKHDEAGSNRCRDGHDRRRGRGKSAT